MSHDVTKEVEHPVSQSCYYIWHGDIINDVDELRHISGE